MYYRKNQSYNSNTYKFEPYTLIAEYLYNKRTELETNLDYEYNRIFRFVPKPDEKEILNLYDDLMKFRFFCLICSDIFDIINLSERAYRQHLSQK